MSASPALLPLPPSPSGSSHPSSPPQPRSRSSTSSSSGLLSLAPQSALSPLSPRAAYRPRFDRSVTAATVRPNVDPFQEGSTIAINQPVGSLSISPSSRDVCLASRKGLYILDLANLNNAPRFIPQGGTWQIADCQWSPHPATANLILSTSSQKLLVWDLSAHKPLHQSINAHARAITDINWHARNPNLMATASMDAGIRGWDLRMGDVPFMRVSAFGAAGTQVKWNRQHEHILATAHANQVIIWDTRKGAIPLTVIKAHDAKIYGIDWDREYRHKLVTCSLDKTIKFWTVPELATADSASHFFPTIAAPDQPTKVISTKYPVWRARNLPFGHGVISLPQRGEKELEMFGMESSSPVETFEGHDDVVKEFVWRTRGGQNPDFEDREFQLVTWSKDRTLRIWPVGSEITTKVGYEYGKPIRALVSRRGAADVTFTVLPKDVAETRDVPRPVLNPSGIARQKPAKPDSGMTRGGGKQRGMDQLEWLTKVVKNRPSPDSSLMQSRIGSLSRPDSRGPSAEGKSDYISLKDEVVMVSKVYSKQKVNFEKIDLTHRKLTMSMNGPWANGNRMAFMRIHWSFPASYPYSVELPTFELERNPTVSPLARQKIVGTIKEMRAENRQCLVQTTGFILGHHERVGRRLIAEESDSESEKDVTLVSNVPMLIRTCGATFGPNGELVCFFPKQTILPRRSATSRSPSIHRDGPGSALQRALVALAHLENPRMRAVIRPRHRGLRRVDNVPIAIQAGSTMTIHDVSHLGQPDRDLASVYGMSVPTNTVCALEAKRFDHAEVWATLRGVLSDPPPPYSRHPPMSHADDIRRQREMWEQGVTRRRALLATILHSLAAAKDLQMLALVGCIILDYARANPPPPRPSASTHTQEQDYFNLPVDHSAASHKKRSSLTLAPLHHSAGSQHSYGLGPISPGFSTSRMSGFSQILNLNPSGFSLRGSSIDLRGSLTPKDRQSFDNVGLKTPLGRSWEDRSPTGLFIPVQSKRESPRHVSIDQKHRHPSVTSAGSPHVTPLKSATSFGTASVPSGAGSADTKRSFAERSALGSSGEQPQSQPGPGALSSRPHKISFSAQSPVRRDTRDGLRRHHSNLSDIHAHSRKRKTCTVKLDLSPLDTPLHSESSDSDEERGSGLIGGEWFAILELAKLAYCDFLLRCDLLGQRATLLQYSFEENNLAKAAAGQVPVTDRKISPRAGDGIVCVSCAGSKDSTCPSCQRRPVRPSCVVCRLPIKGLSAGCAVCSHRTHHGCFRKHFSASLSTCPACPCLCLAERGTSMPFLPFTAPSSPLTQTSPVFRTFAKGSIVPVSPGEGRGRITYASLKGLGTIRETQPSLLGLSEEAASGTLLPPEAHTPLSSMPGSAGPAALVREGSRMERASSRDGRDGLLGRGRRGLNLVGDGVLHWGKGWDG